MQLTKRILLASAAATLVAVASPALAQKKYDPGASDTEIKIGNTNPYSGPASAYGVIGKSIAAYIKMVNEKGGVNGRKINWISYAVFCFKKKTPMLRTLLGTSRLQPRGSPS